jgi:Repeat of unknown function (DUF5648)
LGLWGNRIAQHGSARLAWLGLAWAPAAYASNILTNPDFELGSSTWSVYSSGGYTNSVIRTSASSHSGHYLADLCGYNSCTEQIRQIVTIPSGISTANLQFWYLVAGTDSTFSGVYDKLEVHIDTTDLHVIAKYPIASNTNATGIGSGYWVQSSPIDLTAYAGQTVVVMISATTDGSGPTTFLIDDVALGISTLPLYPTVTEFYNTLLDNYFITANASEAAAIDNGSAGLGWIRTGFTFKSGGYSSVCRFYGSQSPGPNSHFYTADSGECNSLRQLQATTPAWQKRWNFENMDFQTTMTVNGTCPTGTAPVYRAYNNGSSRNVDSNHRITTSGTAINQVVGRGWIYEGVVMCAPM